MTKTRPSLASFLLAGSLLSSCQALINLERLGEAGSGDDDGDLLHCVSRYACNVRGANLLGYYNISREDMGKSVEEVSADSAEAQETMSRKWR